VGGRPVIEYLLERMQAAEPDEIRLVTRPEKVDLVRYARRRRMRVIEEHPRTLSASILSGTRDLARDDVILLGFPDSIWEPVTGFIRLLEVVHAGVDAALGLFRMSEPERSDVVETTPDGRVRAIHVRPEKPRTNRVWGCAALRARVLDALSEDVPVGTLLGEVAGTGGVRGVDLSDLYLDIGTRTGLEEARRRLVEHSSSGLGGRPSSHSTLLP
jgi:NDP-sugar pyrophosphorylase family protein